MKTKSQFVLLLLLLCSAFNPSGALFAQGSLNPPGPPAPMFRTLEEVQPRRPIGTNATPGDTNALFVISQPGSYYLTTNITGVAGKHGIVIAASGVTLDLMGFELVGVSNSLNGVFVLNFPSANIAVRNGTVRDWGDYGVNGFSASNGQYQDLRLSNNGGNGPFGGGLNTGGNSTVVNCTAFGNTGSGILTYVSSAIRDCVAQLNTVYGISAGAQNTVSGCAARENGTGINVKLQSTITRCTASFNTGDGITVNTGCLVVGNVADRNDATGIHILDNSARLEGNNVANNGFGIRVGSTGNLIIRNSASANSTNYVIVAGNKVGPIVAAPNSGAISGDTGGAGVGTTDPWANISY